MHAASEHAPHPGSLAGIRPGQVVTVRRILYAALRDLCEDLGIVEGDTIACVSTSAGNMVLRTPRGRRVVLDRDWARFIQVVTPEVN